MSIRDPFEPDTIDPAFKGFRDDRLSILRELVARRAHADEIVDAAAAFLTIFESGSRPHEVLKLLLVERLDLSAEAKWRLIHTEWSDFDAIPHKAFSLLFRSLRKTWDAAFLSVDNRKFYDALPDRFTAFRGQDARQRAGLSWTLNRDAAVGFARGHRLFFNREPVVISAQISKRNVCGAYVDRKESEIVVFNAGMATPRQVEAVEPVTWEQLTAAAA